MNKGNKEKGVSCEVVSYHQLQNVIMSGIWLSYICVYAWDPVVTRLKMQVITSQNWGIWGLEYGSAGPGVDWYAQHLEFNSQQYINGRWR